MPAPIMCGVVSMAEASDCAGSTLSSYTTLACLVFQSTETDLTPFTRLSEPCTVLVQGGQCRPVTRNVALVGSADCTGPSQHNPRATAANAIIVQRMFRSPNWFNEGSCARQIAGRSATGSRSP